MQPLGNIRIQFLLAPETVDTFFKVAAASLEVGIATTAQAG